MPKTEVILTKHVFGLGAESDHVKVAAGYARNYLIPHGLAIPLTSANKRRIEVLKQRRAEREAHEYNTMSDLAKSVSKLVALLKVKTGDDGKMFGSVTPGMIADHLHTEFDISLDRKKVHLDHPLRTLGEHEVELRLHPEITATLKIRIESLNPPPAPAAEAASEGQTGDRKGRKGAPRSRAPRESKEEQAKS